MCAYVYFIHVYLHRQTDKQSGNQTASQTGGAPPLSGASTLLAVCADCVACHEQLQFVFHFIGLLFIINGEVHLAWLGCEGSIESEWRGESACALCRN